jgi:arylformamidase
VVVPNYSLCPQVGIDDITLQMVQAVAWVWRRAATLGVDRRRIVVAGHSAGGHLAAMMMACDWASWDATLPPHVLHAAVSVSGVFDLDPIRRTPFLQQDLRLTPAMARRLSPARMQPRASQRGRLSLLVGELESSEFHRQAALIARAWGPRHTLPPQSLAGLNHFSVMDDLAREGSAAWQAVMLSLR